jgi:hypothetical protein
MTAAVSPSRACGQRGSASASRRSAVLRGSCQSAHQARPAAAPAAQAAASAALFFAVVVDAIRGSYLW